MEQLSLLSESQEFVKSHVRATDPVTSAIAARDAQRFAGTQTEMILAYLRAHPEGGTIEQIAAGTGLTAVQVARRSKDMKDVGAYVRGVRELANGHQARVWHA